MTSPKFIAFLAVLLFSVVTLAPARGAAQYYAEDENALSSSTTTTTTAIVVGGIVLTVVLVTSGDETASLETYMRQNAVALAQDLTLGAGATIDDLAQVFGVAPRHRRLFGQVLRAHREVLLDLAAPARLDAARAARFVRMIRDAMLTEPRLGPYVVRLTVGA